MSQKLHIQPFLLLNKRFLLFAFSNGFGYFLRYQNGYGYFGKVTHLDLSRNCMPTADGMSIAKAFAAAVGTAECLTRLVLDDNPLGLKAMKVLQRQGSVNKKGVAIELGLVGCDAPFRPSQHLREGVQDAVGREKAFKETGVRVRNSDVADKYQY